MFESRYLLVLHYITILRLVFLFLLKRILFSNTFLLFSFISHRL